MRNAWTQLRAEDGEWVDTLSDVLWPLLDLTYASERRAAPIPAAATSARRALFAAIDDDLCDPESR